MKSDARQGNNGCNYLCRKTILVSFAINPCFLSPCLPARFCELSNELNTQVDNELNTQVDERIKHLSRHPFHANSWIACIAPHGQNQRVPAKPIDDMYLIAQERRVYKAREGLWRNGSERNPSNQYMLEDPRFKLAIKTRVARQGGRDVWQRTYSRLSPFSK